MPFRPDAGPTAKNALVTEDPCPPLNLVIMSGPGCGKGTICKAIVEKFGVVHVSVGDILRKREHDGSDIGEQVHEYITSGRLVPDELAIAIVKEELAREDCKHKGWLLDNFPRTVDQAVAMIDARIIPHKYIHVEVPDHILIERCLGRLIDPVTGDIYHKTCNPPPSDEIAARLVQREDDREEAVKRRLELFHDNMDGVIDFLDEIRREFDGQTPPAELAAQILAHIKPDAPLYAFESARPAVTSADDVREAFNARQEEAPPPPAEGEEPPEEGGLMGDDYRNAIALEIIGECLGKRFDQRVEESRLRGLAYRFSAQHAVCTLDGLIGVLFAESDKGDKAGDTTWHGGDEPAAPSMDTWGRGAVPVKRKLKPLTMENMPSSEGSRPGSSSSRRSARSGRSVRTTRGEQPPVKPKAKAKPVQKEEKTKEVCELSPEERLRASLKAKEDAEKAKARKHKEYLAEVDRMEKLIKQMENRHQSFTFDAKGELLMVNEVPADKLPTPVVVTKGHLLPAENHAPDQPFVQGDALRDSLDPNRVFHPSDTVQPPAAESHTLAVGVTLKEGTVTKSGPAPRKDDLRMTRKEYASMVEGEVAMPGMSLRKTQELEMELSKAKDSTSGLPAGGGGKPQPKTPTASKPQAPTQADGSTAPHASTHEGEASLGGDLPHAAAGGGG